MTTEIQLATMPETSQFVPLGVLGYCMSRSEFLRPVFRELRLRQKTVDHTPSAKLMDVLVSILAGSRAVCHVNTRLRPDVALAQAWGRNRFAAQATLARTLDSFDAEAISQLRQGSETLLRRESRLFRHTLADGWLWLDIDLTPLPISKRAEGSTKGKLGEKTVMVVNWRACMRPNITRRSSRASTLASKTAAQLISPCWRRLSARLASVTLRKPRRSSAVTLGLAAMRT
ncbi:MAG TPA: hypothetical protein VER55_01965 [Ardenticatenaceae bacterium]|nr:hypothetical protein [Ardenticatenaceae bacterium]